MYSPEVVQIPIFMDNYAYLLIDGEICGAVDPAEPEPVLAEIERRGLRLTHVLCTHHHFDHSAGNEAMLEAFPDAVVTGGARERDKIPGLSVALEDGDQIAVGTLTGEVIFVPCHTAGHIAYRFGDALFCGDVVFVGGCGRFFEGNAEDMVSSMARITALPAETRLFCGHEYTVSNLEFAASVEPENAVLQAKLEWARAQNAAGKPTVPSTVADELEYNPFLRLDSQAIQSAVGATDPIAVMGRLREAKNDF